MAAATLSPALSPLLSAEQAAEYLGTTTATLAVWRCRRRPSIPYIKIGKAVRYRRSDIESYLERQTIGGTDQDL